LTIVPVEIPGASVEDHSEKAAEKLLFCIRARLYKLRKNAQNEGHGFSRPSGTQFGAGSSHADSKTPEVVVFWLGADFFRSL
jgi:hypothetical protein